MMTNEPGPVCALGQLHDAKARVELCTVRAEQAQADLVNAKRALAQAAEAYALASSKPGTEFAEKWTRLLDSIAAHGNPNHYDELRQELLAVAGSERLMLVNTTGRVRRDNRQVTLQVLVPAGDERFDKLYLFMLQLAPLLCNRANPVQDEQAAVVDVLVRDRPDSEQFTLMIDPALGRFEALRESRFDSELLFSGGSLREVLEYLRVHYPYHG